MIGVRLGSKCVFVIGICISVICYGGTNNTAHEKLVWFTHHVWEWLEILAKNCKKLQKQPQADVFQNIGVLKNFAIFTGKHLCWSLFKACIFIKKKLQHRCFLVNIVTFLRTAFLQNTSAASVSRLSLTRERRN